MSGTLTSARLRAAGLLAALAVLLVLLAGPALARAASYVALGDSYSSGVGTRDYYADSGDCYRSPQAYPVLVASQLGASLSFTACSGAKTGDVISNQLGPLNGSTTYVTVSVGGNDAGFADVITECAFPSWASDCNGAIDAAQSYIQNTLPGQLDAVYSAINSRAPGAEVEVVGYPRLFNGEDCNAGTWFSPSEEARLNQTADLLASVESGRAAAAGFGFVDPRAAFTGHAVCDNVEWINGMSNPVRESYHPNDAGQASGYTPLVLAALG
jgi:lysophospholipase L1-like esterase